MVLLDLAIEGFSRTASCVTGLFVVPAIFIHPVHDGLPIIFIMIFGNGFFRVVYPCMPYKRVVEMGFDYTTYVIEYCNTGLDRTDIVLAARKDSRGTGDP